MLTLAASHAHEVEIKKSRFIARAARAERREEALAFVESAREESATHNCWAYKIGVDYRFSDDGEPGGTAGQPILRAIEGQGLDHVVCLVTRYFGGIKLGAGGLVRAYGGTAAQCLRMAPKAQVSRRVRLRLEVPFALTGAVFPVLGSSKAARLREEYSDAGLVLEVMVDADGLETFRAAIRDATRGRAVLSECENQAP